MCNLDAMWEQMTKGVRTMMERKQSRRLTPRVYLLLAIGLLLAVLILLTAGMVGADDPVPTPHSGESTQWSAQTVTTAMAAPREKPSKGHPKLASSLDNLLEAQRDEGLAGAKTFAVMHMMVIDGDRVQVVVETNQGAMSDLIQTVDALGGKYQAHYETLLQALVPIEALESLAGRPEVMTIREPRRAIPVAPMRAGAVDTEGLEPSNAPAWHGAGYTGVGVRVAVIDGGFNGYASLLGSDLPASVTAYDWTGSGMGGSEHGTACAEIVHDMAPDAAMDLHKVGTEVELANAVGQAIADGVDVISMSLGWLLGGPGDGTGFLASIVNSARSNGMFYATAAGNNAEHAWSGAYNESGYDTHLWATGQDINYFGPGDGSAWTVPAGSPIVVTLHWDDWTAVDQDYDMCLYYWDGSDWQQVTCSANAQNGGPGQMPEEMIGIHTPVEAPYGVVVWRTDSTRDVCLRLISSHLGPDLDERVSARTLIFPADSPDAITAGAVDVAPPYSLEYYSSQGPTFGSGGTCSGGSTKPDIAAYANVSTVSYGPRGFNGTSAATPHLAGAACLVRDAYPAYTVAQLQSHLEDNAVDLGAPGQDDQYGHGRLYLGLPSPALDVGIDKAAIGSDFRAGYPITFTLAISNSGARTAANVIVTDVVPAEVLAPTFESTLVLTPVGVVPYVWDVEPLGPGEGGVITITGLIDPGLPSGFTIVNLATISDPEDISPANNADAVVITVTRNLPPGVGTFHPNGGSGRVGEWARLTTTYTDPDGYDDLQGAFLFLNRRPPIASGLLGGAYIQTADLLWLQGGEPYPVCRPGQPAFVETDSVMLDCGNSSVSGQDDTLTINWHVLPKQCPLDGCGWHCAIEFVMDRAELRDADLVGWWRLDPSSGTARRMGSVATPTEVDLEYLRKEAEAAVDHAFREFAGPPWDNGCCPWRER